MKLVTPRESHPQETRVAISPETAKKYRGLNLDVVVERGGGASARASRMPTTNRPARASTTAARHCSPAPTSC